jgi:proteasome maturation protein
MVQLEASSEISVGDLSAEYLRTVTVKGPYGIHDTLRNGLQSVAHDLAPRHQLMSTLANAEGADERRRRTLGERLLGSHINTRMMAEKAILAECTRLPGLASSRLGLSVLNGSNETIDVEDILNGTL